MVATWNELAAGWWAWMWPMFWQVGLLVAVLIVLDLAIRRRAWPQLRFALWFLILIKLVLPPHLASPLGFEVPIPEVAGTWEVSAGVAATASPVAPSREAWLFGLWLAGVVLLTLGLRRRHRRQKAAWMASSGPVPDWLQPLAAHAARRLGLRNPPTLRLVAGLPSPAVTGLFRPVVLLPVETPLTVSPPEIEQILLHEMAHIKRGDLWIRAACSFLLVTYWFQPWLWLVRHRLDVLREICCDSTVVRLAPEALDHYRRALVASARVLLERPRPPLWGQLGWAREPASIVMRLQWLGRDARKGIRLRQAGVALLLIASVSVVLPMAPPTLAHVPDPSFTIGTPEASGQNARPEVDPRVQEAFRSPGCLRQRHAMLFWVQQQKLAEKREKAPARGP